MIEQGLLAPRLTAQWTDWVDCWAVDFDFGSRKWQSFRTRQSRALELKTPPHLHARPGRHQVAVKVTDIFFNDTMTIVPVNVG